MGLWMSPAAHALCDRWLLHVHRILPKSKSPPARSEQGGRAVCLSPPRGAKLPLIRIKAGSRGVA
jgi:hypothetical protein